MSRLQQLEHRIDQKLREMLRSSSPNRRREFIEVHRAILDEVGLRVDPLPRGRLSFGYSHVTVRVLAEPERRRSFEVVFVEANALERDIKSYFEDRRVEYPDRLKVDVELVDDLPADVRARGFDVTYSTTESSPVRPESIQIRLTVVVGSAEKTQYLFKKQRINIGRLSEVQDANLRTVRRNDLALKDESGGPNTTVSRTHAHMEFDPDGSRFRLFDDGSAQGTTVLRDGLAIPVPRGASNGVTLQPEDEIIVGQVRIRFEYAEVDSQP